MRAARAARQAEASPERAGVDTLFGKMFDALESSLMEPLGSGFGSSDVRLKKATTGDESESFESAEAMLDHVWRVRVAHDEQARHDRRVDTIQSSLDKLKRERDAFENQIRASLARVVLEEESLVGIALHNAEALTIKAETQVGNVIGQSYEEAAEKARGHLADAAQASNALKAEVDAKHLIAFAGTFTTSFSDESLTVKPGKDLAVAPIEKLLSETIKGNSRLMVTGVVDLSYTGDASTGTASPAAVRKFLAEYSSNSSKQKQKPKNKNEKPPKNLQNLARWSVCVLPVGGADQEVFRTITTAMRKGIRLSPPNGDAENVSKSKSLRRPQSTGNRATFIAPEEDDMHGVDDIDSLHGDDDDTLGVKNALPTSPYPSETRLASGVVSRRREAEKDDSKNYNLDPRMFALYDFESGESEDANQVRCDDESFRLRRVANVGHLLRVLRDASDRSVSHNRGARLRLCFLETPKVSKLESNSSRFVALSDRDVAHLASVYLDAREWHDSGNAGNRHAREGINDAQSAWNKWWSSYSEINSEDESQGGVSLVLVYDESSAVALASDDSLSDSPGKLDDKSSQLGKANQPKMKTVKPAFVACVQCASAKSKKRIINHDGHVTNTINLQSKASSSPELTTSDVAGYISQAAVESSIELAGDQGRADRFPRVGARVGESGFFLESTNVERLARNDCEKNLAAPRDWAARDAELDAAAEALDDAEVALEFLRVKRGKGREVFRERNE